MWKTNDLIGKSIIHQATGERLAQVYDVVISEDAQRILALLVSPGGWLSDAQIISWKQVAAFSDVILVHGDLPLSMKASESAFAAEWKDHARLSGTTIITDGGERLGTVGEMYIDNAGTVLGYDVKQGLVQLGARKFVPVEQVQALGKDAMVVQQSDLPTVTQAQRDQDSASHA